MLLVTVSHPRTLETMVVSAEEAQGTGPVATDWKSSALVDTESVPFVPLPLHRCLQVLEGFQEVHFDDEKKSPAPENQKGDASDSELRKDFGSSLEDDESDEYEENDVEAGGRAHPVGAIDGADTGTGNTTVTNSTFTPIALASRPARPMS